MSTPTSGKQHATLVIRGIQQCLTMSNGALGPLAGAQQASIGLIEDAAIAADGERIVYAGPAGGLLGRITIAPDAVTLDAQGGVVVPGFVDPHTHLLFGGWRPAEFGQRIAGASYHEILEAGGGILNTVDATRSMTEEELVELGSIRLRRMLEGGTTTVEAKSGYGLDLATESRLVRAARRLEATEAVDIVVTLLGAHAVPRDHREDRGAYLAQVEEMIAVLADRVDFVDAFCERGAFSVPECRRIFALASRHGLRAKVHADQLGDGGGAALAAEVRAISADHLDYVSDDGIAAMAAAGVIAVLLPSVPLYLGSPHQAPYARLVDAGVPVALATDFNPGTSPLDSMAMIVALGCMLLRMSPEAALVSSTRNAAHAIGRGADVGTLEPGKLCDVQIYDVDDYRMLPYRFGRVCPRWVIKRGAVVAEGQPSAPGR